MAAAACKAPSSSPRPLCPLATPTLFERSYRIPPRWPFPPIDLVMEERPGRCDYYRSSEPCCKISETIGAGPEGMIERPVREVLISFLSGCSTRANGCRAADFGGNNGWMSMYMLALGANVTSIEPASDFAEAIHLSGRLNCWSHRHVVLNAFACEREEPRFNPRGCMRPRRAWNGYRASGGAPDGLKERLLDTYGRTAAQILAGAPLVPPPGGLLVRGSAIKDVIVEQPTPRGGQDGALATRPRHYDLIKLDGDGPEGGWMRAIDSLLGQRRVTASAITLEGNNLDIQTMMRFQQRHGYDIYRLDIGDDRRHLSSLGWDDYAPEGTPMASLARAAGMEKLPGGAYRWRPRPPRDALETEVFGIRAMRHLYKVKANLSLADWMVVLGPIWRYDTNRSWVRQRHPHQWLLTTDATLAEPVTAARFRRRGAKGGGAAEAAEDAMSSVHE